MNLLFGTLKLVAVLAASQNSSIDKVLH